MAHPEVVEGLAEIAVAVEAAVVALAEGAEAVVTEAVAVEVEDVVRLEGAEAAVVVELAQRAEPRSSSSPIVTPESSLEEAKKIFS